MRIKSILESRRFESFIIVLIILNAITLGLETSIALMTHIGHMLVVFDSVILTIFVLEIIAKLYVYRLRFFHDSWRIFDFLIVGISLIPAAGSLSILRSLRVLRVLRLISTVPSLRRVVGGLISALPGIGSIAILLLLVFYVFSVIATKLYGVEFPQWFGNIGASAYSLFQIMTLESWSMGIVRPVMTEFPYAWIFFIIFILCTSFTVLNLFIGIIVSAIQTENDNERRDEFEEIRSSQALLLQEVISLKQKMEKG